MKSIRLTIFTITAVISLAIQGQLFHPLGLGIETSREMAGDFQPQIYIEGDILYACTIQGLYFKDMSDEGSEWQLAGFEGIPVLDYVRRGDDIFALCFNGQNDIFLLSHDGGQTYEDATPDNFRYYINKEGHVFWYFNQHPTDPNTFLLSSFHAAGIFLTTDFGQTWNKLTSYTPEYMGFHPLNPEIIYECSGGGYTDEKTDIRISYDGGQTWKDKCSCFPNYHRIFRMAFHPTDPNKWIVGGGAYIYATNDYGQTWNIQRLDNYEIDWRYEAYGIDWRYAAYDDENADVVYMAGGHHGEYMKVMCSTDGGKTWNKPCQEPAKTTPYEYVFDMKQYGDKLLVYSQSDVYEISKAELLAQGATPVQSISATLNGKSSNGKWYDLQGRRVNAEAKRGVYIENGKKWVKYHK